MRLVRLTLAVLATALAAAPAAWAAVNTGDILVANPNQPNAEIIKVDGATGEVSALTGTGIASPNILNGGAYEMVLQPDGRLMVITFQDVGTGTGGVVAVDPNTGAQTLVASGPPLSAPLGLAREPSGSLIVADDSATSLDPVGGLIRVNPSDGSKQPVSSNQISGPDLFADPYGVAVERSGRLLVADLESGPGGTGAIIAVDPNTGQQSLVTNNDVSGPDLLKEPAGVLVRPDGRLLVFDYNSGSPPTGAVLNLDASGQLSVFSNNDVSGPDLFSDPHRGALDLNGRLLVADFSAEGGPGAVIGVDSAGQQSLVASNASAGPDVFKDPTAVLVVPPKCGGLYPTIVGTPGKDSLKGTPFTDVVVGLGGKDTIKGMGADDVLCGGPGKDKLYGQGGKDKLFGEAGADLLVGGKKKDKLHGGKGKDTLRQ
jgi:Ca2+-binding RTX toxin-like protein